MSESYCAGCGVQRAGPGIEGSAVSVTPCPNCGVVGIDRRIVLADSAVGRDCLGSRSRGLRDGKRKNLRESKQGTEFFRKDGRWHEIWRVVDHVNDWYDEVITDEETGQVVHECHEPLSQHHGHGSARRGPQRGEDTEV